MRTTMSSGSTIGIGWFPATGTVKCARFCNRARRVEAGRIGGLLAAVDEAQALLTLTVVDEDDDEFGIDDRHRLVSGDGNGEVREVLQPGAQGRGEDALELGQRPRRGLFHPADDAA